MTRAPIPTQSLGGLNEQIAETSAALKSLKAPAEEAASDIETAFSRAGQSLAKSLARAASDGKISLSELSAALLRAFEQLVAGSQQSAGSSLADALKGALTDFGGARADGGLVTPGSSYVVGERGPEVFRPAATGIIEPFSASGPQVVVNLNLGAEAAGLVRSESQLAATIQRAARLGAR
jgi:hypothetical protein